METIIRIPDEVTVLDTDEAVVAGAVVSFIPANDRLEMYLEAPTGRPAAVRMRWYTVTEEPVSVLGDDWERTYGHAAWRNVEGERDMPWFFFVHHPASDTTWGHGVAVQPGALISFRMDTAGISMYCDVRSGSDGIDLNGRKLHIGTLVSKKYEKMTAFSACRAFCRELSPAPLLPREPVYGGNNWYYAYGNSTRASILSDAALQSRLAGDLANRPFMVIDDGWTVNRCAGPWISNEKHGDMKTLAAEMKNAGVRPGIWLRYMRTKEEGRFDSDAFLRPEILDITHPAVRDYIREVTRTLVLENGFQLLKHDFSFNDTFNAWGHEVTYTPTSHEVRFHDGSKTTAEIITDFYRLILDATEGRAYILGCNCINHLGAGLFHLNRSGDDTSGRCWAPTRKMGVNSLAFRLMMNKSFCMIDADCVGMMKGRISWAQNREWATLLARSGSPLFISCADGTMSAAEEEEMAALYRFAALQQDETEPVDWLWNNTPNRWLINGEERRFNWYIE